MTRHLRLLLDPEPSLPPPLAARRDAWARAATGAAAALSAALQTDVAAGPPDLALTDARACARRATGVFCPLSDERGILQVPDEDTRRLAALLLRTDDAEAPPVLLDALLMRTLGAALLAPIDEAFGGGLALEDRHPLFGWPGEDDAAPVLTVRLPFDADACAFSVSLHLNAPHTPYAASPRAPASAKTLRAAALSARCQVDAVLDDWRLPAREAATLRAGQRLALPGASVESLRLRLQTANGSMDLGLGELGRDGSRQAVRVTRVTHAA